MAHLHEVKDSDTHFIINPVTMAISNAQNEKNKLQQGDHNSEIFTFQIPKEVEGHDMSLCDVVRVHYINTSTSKADISKDIHKVVDMEVAEDDAETLVFTWLIHGNATKYNGSLAFRILFACTDENDNYTYKKWTEIYKGISIGEGFENEETVLEAQADILKQEFDELEKQMEELTKELENDFSQLSEEISNAGSGMTATVKNALLEFAANVAWATAEGQACYDKLKTALNESVGEIKLSSITATCSETAQIGTAASDLDIVVTAIYSDGSSAQVTGWTTSGTVVEGTNTFVVSYGGKYTNVTVAGVDLYYVLNNATNKSELMSSKTYSDGGETSAGFPNVYCAWHLWGSKVVEQDTSVKIKYIPSVNNYNGVYAYCMNPETFTGSTTGNKYYAVRLASPALVDTSYEWEYTIKAGYAFGISLGSDSPVPTVEVVS